MPAAYWQRLSTTNPITERELPCPCVGSCEIVSLPVRTPFLSRHKSSLCWLSSFKGPYRQARLVGQERTFCVSYKSGHLHQDASRLSRHPHTLLGTTATLVSSPSPICST